MKSTEIIGDVKKRIVCEFDSGEIISAVQDAFSGNTSLTVETDRSPPSYTMYCFTIGNTIFIQEVNLC